MEGEVGRGDVKNFNWGEREEGGGGNTCKLVIKCNDSVLYSGK